jgi:hypothetical protein
MASGYKTPFLRGTKKIAFYAHLFARGAHHRGVRPKSAEIDKQFTQEVFIQGSTMDNGSDVIYSGSLRKKGGRVNVWSERFFVLKGSTLFYYVKSTDAVSSAL